MPYRSTRFRFITGNPKKFAEAQAIIPALERLDADLPEIQSLDPREVVMAKLEHASRSYVGTLIVEDTSLFLDCLGGMLPGPFIKWFLQSLGARGIHDLAARYGITGARGMCMVGVMTYKETRFFAGEIRGTIVPYTADNAFGWDPIFRPDGAERTFAEMTMEEKNRDSHRAIAFRQLKAFLEEKDG